ncbi:MAG TPA: glycoside hydrolase family 2 TIM barrel-domain containing protein [Lacipirellulaceae bacterium]
MSAVLFSALDRAQANGTDDFNGGWRVHLGEAGDASRPDFDDSAWQTVQLPHTPRIEALVTGTAGPESRQWQGICWYRKSFPLDQSTAGKTVILKFGAAMRVAEVWVNGESLGKHVGDYLPVVLDISQKVHRDSPNVVAVRLDNTDNPDIGPKPLATLDFNFYGGLYRGAELIVKSPLHITEPNLANQVASGGVFVTYPKVSDAQATVRVQTHLQNDDANQSDPLVRTSILDKDGKLLAKDESAATNIPAGKDAQVVQEIELSNPPLWSIDSPNLCTVVSEVVVDGKVVDRQDTRVGIRNIKITKDGFWLNGKKMFLRGSNRHQEYPYIGYALSDNAQYRDAKKIKDAGFDYIRLSHYPQSPAFLDACDELGLLVENSVTGWQYFSKKPEFSENQYRQCAEFVRRDRNHPCVLLWEVSLNETRMPKDFMDKMNSIAHAEYPGDQCLTCGWAGDYDVFIQARQHGGCRNVKDRPCLVSEYGDWEYFAQNAGLNQEKWADLKPAERSSRQVRGDGEVRLLQQALNFQEAHNDNRKTPAFADNLWVMYDYNRGYSPDLETSGCMDVFRLPKPAYYFYQSQRDPEPKLSNAISGPIVYIANNWTESSPTSVRVYSNCDEVSLFVNDRLVGTQKPDDDRFSTNLAHPPFTFKLERFQPGSLRAVGKIGGKEVASQVRATPGEPAHLRLDVDLSGRPLQAGVNDVLFVHAIVEDAKGTAIPVDSRLVSFAVDGPAELIGDNSIAAEAGIASILLRASGGPGKIQVTATTPGLESGSATVEAVAANK